MTWDELPEWRQGEILGLTPEERANLRSGGDVFPDPPPPPPEVRKRRELLSGAYECPHCHGPLAKEVERLGFDGRYIRVPPDWTDDEIRWAANQIKTKRQTLGREGAY